MHLNPVRARLVEHPADWKRSSYPGYARRRSRLPWVAHDDLLAAWAGEFGGSGSEPETSYRKYVTAGLAQPPESPWSEAFHGWILGSQKFVDRVRALVQGQPQRDRRCEARQVRALTISRVSEVVCAEYGIDELELSRRGSRHPARAAMAYLARRHTVATNSDLAPILGVSRAESVPNLTRRFEALLSSDSRVRKELNRVEAELSERTAIELTRN